MTSFESPPRKGTPFEKPPRKGTPFESPPLKGSERFNSAFANSQISYLNVLHTEFFFSLLFPTISMKREIIKVELPPEAQGLLDFEENSNEPLWKVVSYDQSIFTHTHGEFIQVYSCSRTLFMFTHIHVESIYKYVYIHVYDTCIFGTLTRRHMQRRSKVYTYVYTFEYICI